MRIEKQATEELDRLAGLIGKMSYVSVSGTGRLAELCTAAPGDET